MNLLLFLLVLFSTTVLASPADTSEKPISLPECDAGSSNEVGPIELLPFTVDGNMDSDISHLVNLPVDVLLNVVNRLSPHSTTKLRSTCTWMYNAVPKDANWLQLLHSIETYDEKMWMDDLLPTELCREYMWDASRRRYPNGLPDEGSSIHKFLRNKVANARDQASSDDGFKQLLAAVCEQMGWGLGRPVEPILKQVLVMVFYQAANRITCKKRYDMTTMDSLVAFLLSPDSAENLKAFETAIRGIYEIYGCTWNYPVSGICHGLLNNNPVEVNAMGSTFQAMLEHIREARLSCNGQAKVDSCMIEQLVPKLQMEQEKIKKVFDQARRTVNVQSAVELKLASVVRRLLEFQDRLPQVIFNKIIHHAWNFKNWEIAEMLLEHPSYSDLSEANFQVLVSMAFRRQIPVGVKKRIGPLLLKNPHSGWPVSPTVDKIQQWASNSPPHVPLIERMLAAVGLDFLY